MFLPGVFSSAFLAIKPNGVNNSISSNRRLVLLPDVFPFDVNLPQCVCDWSPAETSKIPPLFSKMNAEYDQNQEENGDDAASCSR